jgi:4-diphosphocytidyl-2C-methyl-D-erythritol kinase
MNRIRIKAPAKINIALEVLGKRPDGYHEIVTVLQTMALYDELILEPYPSLQVEGDLTGPEDLVIQAALDLQSWAPQRGARIRLEKRIPVGAGLGRGSSCAAATLLGLARLWDLKRAEEEEGLHRLAERLGSDVPFFLQALQGRGGTALAWGRGEQIKPLPSPPTQWLVLLFLPLHLERKTATLYGLLRPQHYTSGEKTLQLAQSLEEGLPLEDADTQEDWEEHWGRCWGHVLKGAGVGPGDRVLVAFSFVPFIGFWATLPVLRKVGVMFIPGGGTDSLQRLFLIQESQATVLCCTPTYALRLAEVAREHGIDTRALSVRKTIHAGEPGANVPEVKRRIEKAWNAHCFDHAGASEVGAHSFECQVQPGGIHVNESDFILEVLDPQTGRPVPEGSLGELVLTNLGR